MIANIRRLLDNDVVCSRLRETARQFIARMKLVEDFMNSQEFAKAGGGRGLAGLARELPARCDRVIAEGGGRIPK